MAATSYLRQQASTTTLDRAAGSFAACHRPTCWSPSSRPAAAAASRRQRRGSLARCQAKNDVGRILRDAVNQPAQGQNLAYLAAGNYLRGLGINSQPECNRILDIAMNPNSLYTSRDRKQPTNPHARKLDVEEDLKPVIEFLEGQGLSNEQIIKAVTVHPALLCYPVAGRLQPFFAYLTEEFGLTQQDAARVIERRPSLLGVAVGNLQRMVGFLLEAGNSKEAVTEMMSTSL